jgi:hypothetical protein
MYSSKDLAMDFGKYLDTFEYAWYVVMVTKGL